MEKILTIVIPTYNMQDYLRRCLDSLIVPEDQMQLLEVLVVNDGSKDNSSAIAHEYQDKYPDTFRVIDKENGNYGSCVNRGLKEATGKYFRILDADDWFDSKVLNKFLVYLQTIDVDVVYTSFATVRYDGSIKKNVEVTSQKQFETEIIVDLTVNTLQKEFFHMHSLTYKTSLLKNICFKQEEKICYTDTEYVFYPLCHAKTLICLDDVLYQYYVGREGQSMSLTSMAKNFEHFNIVLNNLLNYNLTYCNPTSLSLSSYYFVVLLRYMLDIHLFSALGNIKQEQALKKLVEIIIARNSDYKIRINNIKRSGCHYVSWWLNKTWFNKIKLSLFIKIKKTIQK